MVVIRVVGGPVAKQERLAIDVDPQRTAFGDMFALTQAAWDRRPNSEGPSGNRQVVVIDAKHYTLVELEDATDANGKPTVRPLGPLPLSSTLAQYPLRFPAILLKESTASTLRRTSVSFESPPAKVRVIGGPILASDRIFVEDDAERRATVPLASDVLEAVAVQLPGSVDPPVVAEHYELWEVEGTSVQQPGGAPSTTQVVPVRELKPFDPVKLGSLRCPLLLLKPKLRVAAVATAAQPSSENHRESPSARSPYVSPETNGSLTSSSLVVEELPPSLHSVGAAHGAQAVSPSRRESSFFRTVANAVLGTRRASTMFDGDDVASPPRNEQPAPTATTIRTVLPQTASPAPAPAASPATSIEAETSPFLKHVTFTLVVHFYAPSDAIDDNSRLGEPSTSLVEVLSQAAVVTPHMSLASIAGIVLSQLPATRRDVSQQTVYSALDAQRGVWFASAEQLREHWHDALTNPPSRWGCLMESTPLALSLRSPVLFVLCSSPPPPLHASIDGGNSLLLEGATSSASFAPFGSFAEAVGAPAAAGPVDDDARGVRKRSSFLLRSAPHESPLVGEVVQLYATHCGGVHPHDWMVRTHRVVARCATRRGQAGLSSMAQMARQVFDASLLEPDVSTSVGGAALKARLRHVLDALSSTAPSTLPAPPATVVDGWYRPEKTHWHAVHDVCSVLAAYQAGTIQLLRVQCHAEPAARLNSVLLTEGVDRQALEALVVERLEHCRRNELHVWRLVDHEATSRGALERRCWCTWLDVVVAHSAPAHRRMEEEAWSCLCMAAICSEEASRRCGTTRDADTTLDSMWRSFASDIAQLQEDHFVRRTSAEHFEQEAAARRVIADGWRHAWAYYATYFDQFIGRKVLLARNEVWWGGLDLMWEAAERCDALQSDAVAPFYRNAWAQHTTLLEEHEGHCRTTLRQASIDGYVAIVQRFDQWIADRDALRDQLARMELSKSERIARHGIQERQAMDSSTLYGVISDSLHHRWEQHMGRVAVEHKEERKRALWGSINDELRGIWWELRSAMILQSSEHRKLVHEERTRLIVLNHLSAEINDRLSMLREEAQARAEIGKLHVHVVCYRVHAMRLVSTNSHRVLLTDEEERARTEIEQRALSAYASWDHWNVLMKGEMVWRSLLQVDEDSSAAVLRLLDAEIQHRREWMRQRTALLRSLFDAFDAIKFEMTVHASPSRRAGHHDGAACSTRQFRIEGPPDLMPKGRTSLSLSVSLRGETTAAFVLRQLRALPVFVGHDAISTPQVALCVPKDPLPLLLHPADVVEEGVSVLRLTRSPSAPLPRGDVANLSMAAANSIADSCAFGLPVASQPRKEPIYEGSLAGPVASSRATQPSKAPAPTIRRSSSKTTMHPTNTVNQPKPERTRSPPRKAPLPDVVRRQSTMPHATLQQVDAAAPQPTLFAFRVFGLSKKPLDVKLEPTACFASLLPLLHDVHHCTSISSFEDCFVYPAVLLSGKVTPTGPPLQAHDTVQGKGLFGGALLLLKRQRVRTPPPYAAPPLTGHDAEDKDVAESLHHSEWDVVYGDGQPSAGWVEEGMHDDEDNESSVARTWMGASSDASPRTETVDNDEAPLAVATLLQSDAPPPSSSLDGHANADANVTSPQYASTDESCGQQPMRHDSVNVPRSCAEASEASDSLVSLPVLSSSKPPIEFERPQTPTFDEVPMYGEDGFPCFGDAVTVPEWMARKMERIASEAAPQPEDVAEASFVADNAEPRDRLHDDDTTEARCNGPKQSGDDAPIRNPLETAQSPITHDDHKTNNAPDEQHAVAPSAVPSTDDCQHATLVTEPRLEKEHRLQTSQEAIHMERCTIVGGPIPSDAPLVLSVGVAANLGDLFDAVAAAICANPMRYPTIQPVAVTQAHYFLAEMVLVPGKPPALKQRSMTAPVTQCSGRLFALRATPLAKRIGRTTSPPLPQNHPNVGSLEGEAKVQPPDAVLDASVVVPDDSSTVSPHATSIPQRSVSPDPIAPGLPNVAPLSLQPQRLQVSPPPQRLQAPEAVPQAPEAVPLLIVVNGVSVSIPHCSTEMTLFDAVDGVAAELEALHVHDSTTRFVPVDGCTLYTTDATTRTLDFHDPVRRLCRVKTPRNVCVLQLQAKATSIAMEEPLLDLSDLPNCVVAVQSDDPWVASLMLRPAVDITVRGLVRMMMEKLDPHTTAEGKGAPPLHVTHTIRFDVFRGLNDLLVATHFKGLGGLEPSAADGSLIESCNLSTDDLDTTMLTLLQLSSHKPSYVAANIVKRPTVETPPVAITAATIKQHVEPPKPKGLFERLRNAILGPPPTEDAQLTATSSRDTAATAEAQPQEETMGFEYGRHAPAEDGALAPRLEPISIRVLGGPIFAATKIIVTMAATESVSSIYAHARNRLIELGHIDEALRVAPDKYNLFYVKRQFDQRPKAEQQPLDHHKRLDACHMERGSHVVMLKARKDAGDGLAIGEKPSATEAVPSAANVGSAPPQRVRIVGGPIPKTARVFIDLPPLNVTYAHWLPLIDDATQAAVPLAPRITEAMFTLSEVDVTQGGAGSIRRTIPLEHSFDSSPLQSLVISLKKRPAASHPVVSNESLDVQTSPTNSLQPDRHLITPPPDVLAGSFTKSVSWSDQSPSHDANAGKFQRVRVRVIGTGIPGPLKLFVDLVGWMTFGAVFRLVAEQLRENGLEVHADFDEDHYCLSSMALDSTKVLVPERTISSLDEVRSALAVKVLLVSPIDTTQPPVEGHNNVSPTNEHRTASAAVLATTSRDSSPQQRTSRELTVRVVGIPGLPQACNVFVQITMSTSFRAMFGIIDAAAIEAHATYNATLAERGEAPCPRPPTIHEKVFSLAEMEVHASGQYRRKQTLEPDSTPFLSDFGATMSCIQVERRRNPVLSGSTDSEVVDAFTPKRTKERQRRSSLESPPSLPSGSPNLWDTRLRLTRSIDGSTKSSPPPLSPTDDLSTVVPPALVPLPLDDPVVASPVNTASTPKADPFDVDVDWHALSAPQAEPTTHWDDSPVMPSMELPAAIVAALPPIAPTVGTSDCNRMSPDAAPSAALVTLPLSVPMELAGDDSEYEEMGAEESESMDDAPISAPTVAATTRPQAPLPAVHPTPGVDDEAMAMIRMMMQDASPTASAPPLLSTPSPAGPSTPDSAPSPARSSASPREGFDEDVEADVVGADAVLAQGHDHRGSSSSSPKHYHGQHRSTVGSPWGSFRKRLAENIDRERTTDASPKATLIGDSLSSDAVCVSALDVLHVVDTLPPLPTKARSSASLLEEATNDDAEREAILAFGDMIHRNSTTTGRQKHLGSASAKHALVGLEDLDDQRQALLKIERELNEPLPHLKLVGAARAPLAVAGATRKGSTAKAHQQPQRSQSIEPKRRSESGGLGGQPSGPPRVSASMHAVHDVYHNHKHRAEGGRPNVGPNPNPNPPDVHNWMQSLDTVSSDAPPPSSPPTGNPYYLPPVVAHGQGSSRGHVHHQHAHDGGRRSSSIRGGAESTNMQERLEALLGVPQQHKLSFVESLRGPTKQSR